MNAIALHTHLQELHAKRALASVEGLTSASAHLAELDTEIEIATQAYVQAAVTEIAILRADLSGPQRG